MGNNRIYLSPPHMSGKEIEFVQDAFKSNWIAIQLLLKAS